jgi:hypothetical protein
MKRTAIFVEGECEKIFVYNLLLKVFDPSKIQITSLQIRSGNNFENDSHQYGNRNAEFDFLLVDAGSDVGVVSSICGRAKKMINELGYSSVIGLRDLYCNEYDKLSPGIINHLISEKIINSAKKTINTLGLSSAVCLFFSVMELEAWYFGFPQALERIGYHILDINRVLRVDISSIDVEASFYKPKTIIKKIHNAVKNNSFDEVKFAHRISSAITIDEITSIINSGKFSRFKIFVNYLQAI